MTRRLPPSEFNKNSLIKEFLAQMTGLSHTGIGAKELEKHFGMVYRIQSLSMPKHVLHLRDTEVWVDEGKTEDDDTMLFTVVPGLTGVGIALQSVK